MYVKKCDKRSSIKSSPGYVTLMSVLILGAVGTSIVISLLLLGLSTSRTSFAYEQSVQARALAHACAEEGLQQIRDLTSFTGTDTISLGYGFCTYTVASGGGQNRTITSSGIVGTIVRKVTVIVDAVNPQINVSSWQEVAEL